nr:hypothetical protein [Tanacetum cinerariifolium]
MFLVELTNEDIKNSKAYKEYYAIASGATPPKTKESVRKTKSSFDTTITPPTIIGTKLSTLAKGKQPAKSSKAKDEGTGIILGVPDVPNDKSDEEISWKSSDEDDNDDDVDKRSDDQNDDDDQDDDDQDDNDDDQDIDNDGNGDASLGLNVGSKEGQDEEDDDDELYKDVNINLEEFVDVQALTTVASLTLTTPTLLPPTIPTISQFAGAVSSILEIVERYMDQRMNEVVKVDVQIQFDRLQDKAHAKNEEFRRNLDENIQKIIKDNKSIQRSDEQWNLYKALVDAYESDKIIWDTYGDSVMLKRRHDDVDKDEEPFARLDRGSKRRREGKEPELTSAPKENATKTIGKSTQGSKSHQKTASESAPAEEPMQKTQDLEEPSHQEFKIGAADDQPIAEASQHLEWFQQQKKPLTPYRAWNKTLFINNDLEYLRGGAFSLKYTTSVTETKAADYGHIKWIEDLVPRTMWSQEPIGYDKYSLWGISHWGCKRQQFYGFAVNKESARDVYSKRRIIVVIKLQIVEWHDYKHLDWIMVQGKLTNLTVEERFAFNVSLRMFTRSIVIHCDGTLNDVRTALDDHLKGIG